MTGELRGDLFQDLLLGYMARQCTSTVCCLQCEPAARD